MSKSDKLAYLVMAFCNVGGVVMGGARGIDPGFFWVGAVISWAAYMLAVTRNK